LLALFRLVKVCESLPLHLTAYDLSKVFATQFRVECLQHGNLKIEF